MPVSTLYRQLHSRLTAREPMPPKVALIRQDASPAQASRETFDLICRSLSGSAIPFFCVRPTRGRPPVIAVRVSYRQRAITSLARHGLYGARLPGGRHKVNELGKVRQLRRNDMGDAKAIRLWLYYASPSRTLTLGPESGVDLEFWSREGELLVAPRPNRVCEAVPVQEESVDAPESLFNRLVAGSARLYPTRPEFACRLVDDVDFPIDAVYTWVDGNDPAWRARKELALTGGLSELATSEARFVSRDELRYSLRSLMTYAPWIRNIYVVTDQQKPSWLVESDRIRIVDHKEIFADTSVLPVFNSHAIESRLHHIEGLSEHFLYLNDDFFLGKVLYPETFFEGNGITRFFPSIAQVPFTLNEDNPVHQAGMNNRRMLEELCGRTLTQKMKHVPYALRRSLLFELEERFPAAFKDVSASRFRRSSDISTASSLAHYYGYLSGRAIPGQIDYTYVDLALPKTPAKLRRMLANREHDAFCLNDTAPTTADQDSALARFLDAYYPIPTPFESH